MKTVKFFSALFAALLVFSCFSACEKTAEKAADGALCVVATIFPAYDFVKNVVGDAPVNVKLLLDNGVDLHSYQPTAEDILAISSCDLFIYVGGESDKWVEDVVSNAINKEIRSVDMMEVLGDALKEEETVPGMQTEEDNEEEEEYDEHVWLSLKNAAKLIRSISRTLKDIDPENAEKYEENASAYIEKINALDKRYKAVVDDAPVKTLVFADRFPFRYLTDDYGLSYYAAFAGCSAETEASFKTVTFLANKTDELGLRAVMKTESSDGKIAETVVRNMRDKDMTILSLDSMQTTTAKDVKNGVTYLSVMESNLEVLKQALK